MKKFKMKKTNDKVKALLFTADWCSSCFQTKRKFLEISKKLDIRYDVIDVESETGVNFSIKHQVRNVPTILIFNNGQLVGRETGSLAYQKIQNYLQ